MAIVQDGRISFHGELSDLKDSVKRLRITSENTLPNVFAVPGALSAAVEGNRAIVAVREVSPELISALGRQWNAQIEVEDLNLEDIFLELHHAS